MMTSNLKWGTLISLVSGVAFATLAIFAKLAYAGGANVPTVLFLRFAGAALIFWLYFLIRKEKIGIERGTVIKLLIMGSFGYGIMSTFYLSAVSLIPASLAVMLLYLHPALVAVATTVLKLEKFNKQKVISLVLTFTGLILVLGISPLNVDILGILCGIGAASVYTVYIIAGSQVLKPLEPLRATMYIMLGGAISYGIYGAFSNSISLRILPQIWLSVGGIVLVATVVAVSSFWIGVKLIGPTRTTIISTVEPLATVVLAWMLFEESFNGLQMLGGIMIILGVLVLQYSPKNEKKSR